MLFLSGGTFVSINEKDIRIIPYVFNREAGEIHYAVYEKDKVIAFCTFESSAISVRNDAIRKAQIAERSG